ncbi:MAG: FeoB-associated Cys-rich membrane protein [Clostridia bacterium]|nr:FeoB-associated Cys-rich membrane protein [Clostridia bacterium]
MGNVIVLGIIAVTLCMSIYKLYVDKKNGVQCVGCPHSPKGFKKGDIKPCSTTQIVTLDLKRKL